MAEFPVSLFAALMRSAPFQPATNLWRAIELHMLVEKAFPYLKACKSLLDLGCGDGEVMRLLRPHLPTYLVLKGLDPDEKEVEMAQRTGLYSDVFCRGGGNIPLANESLDAIISNSVLEHIPDIDPVLLESARSLKSGGYFVATVPGPEFHGCLRGPLWSFGDKRSYVRMLDQRLAHLRYWGETQWQDAFKKAGMKLECCSPYFSAQQVRRWEVLSNMTGGLMSNLLGVRPIEAQRKLGLRQSWHLPIKLAHLLAYGLALGLSGRGEAPFGCLLLVARKDR